MGYINEKHFVTAKYMLKNIDTLELVHCQLEIQLIMLATDYCKLSLLGADAMLLVFHIYVK